LNSQQLILSLLKLSHTGYVEDGRLVVRGAKEVDFGAERPPHGDVGIAVYFSNVPMKMVSDSSLLGVDRPIARAIEMISEFGSDSSHIRVVDGAQLLLMAQHPCVDDHGHLALVAEHNGEFLVAREGGEEKI